MYIKSNTFIYIEREKVGYIHIHIYIFFFYVDTCGMWNERKKEQTNERTKESEKPKQRKKYPKKRQTNNEHIHNKIIKNMET